MWYFCKNRAKKKNLRSSNLFYSSFIVSTEAEKKLNLTTRFFSAIVSLVPITQYINAVLRFNIRTGIEEVITALTRNQVVARAARGFESHPVRQRKPHKPSVYAVLPYLYCKK